MQQVLGDADRQRLVDAGVVADIVTSLVLADGSTARTHLDDRRIAISEEELRAVPEVIGAAGGIEKTEAIRAVLKGNWITTLVTNREVASAL